MLNSKPAKAMPARVRTSINVPKQDRSRASFERVLDTAEELLKEHGYKGFTLHEVSKQSRTSIGSIYCRVRSKDDLFHAVQDHVLARLDAEMESILDPAKWNDVEPAKLIRFLVREMAEFLRRHAPILRALISRELVDPVIMKKGKRAHARLAARFQSLLLKHAEEFSHPEPEHAVGFCFNLTYAAIAKHLDLDTVTPSNDGSQWNQFIDDLGRIVSLFLLSSESFEFESSINVNRTARLRRSAGGPHCVAKALRD
jgi:AcrR family transcriptional regulator